MRASNIYFYILFRWMENARESRERKIKFDVLSEQKPLNIQLNEQSATTDIGAYII